MGRCDSLANSLANSFDYRPPTADSVDGAACGLPPPKADGTFFGVSILLSNDDGVSSEGLAALRETLASLDEVWVVAPDRDQSAVSHSLTLHRPLRIEQVGVRTFAVDGTPTDCVNLAINGILRERPWLVMSGINHGANLGDDITYSGTVSAAMEGTLLGIPAIAVSLVGRARADFGAAASFTKQLAATVLRDRLPPDTLLNVNVPDLPPAEIKGFVLTRQGKRRYGDAIVEKVDPRGKKYYWIGGDKLDFVDAEGTDFSAVERGMISVTPLHLDLTNYTSLQGLARLKVLWP
jgi:5'-nucleotidase